MIDDELELDMPQNQAKLLIFSDTQWSGALQSTTFGFTEISGQNDDDVVFECESSLWVVRESLAQNCKRQHRTDILE